MPRGIYPRASVAERFERMVDRSAGPNACHLWLAGQSREGYGNIWIEGTTKSAHVVAWTLAHGQPDGVIRHHCRTRHCVNIRHLELGSMGDNNRDRKRDGTQAYGEDHHRAKLTEQHVRAARVLRVFGLTWREIALRLDVNHATIRDAASLRARRSWRETIP